MAWVAAGAFVVVVVLLALTRRQGSRDPRLRLLVALLPSWRFFEEVEAAPLLSFRVIGPDDTPGPWELAIPPRQHGGLTPFFHPQGNLRLAATAVVERLVDELAERSPVPVDVAEGLVSMQLCRRIVRTLQSHRLPSGTRYQLRLATFTPALGPNEGIEEELWVSPIEEVER